MGKRVFDVLLSSTLLVGLAPVLAGLYAAVQITLHNPVIFQQNRVGKDGKPFTIYKFRTMRDLKDADGNLLPDSARVTKLGKFMRRIGLDELPQLINILKGDMSFVGPRPRLVNDPNADQLDPQQISVINTVAPGLTGPSQIKRMQLRRTLTLKEKLKIDWDYAVKQPSMLNDLKIIFDTLPIFIVGNGDNSTDTTPRKITEKSDSPNLRQ
jgi:lipopolysaccharide/colanic/teichoic acid biosynthesis glycosyltransferase